MNSFRSARLLITSSRFFASQKRSTRCFLLGQRFASKRAIQTSSSLAGSYEKSAFPYGIGMGLGALVVGCALAVSERDDFSVASCSGILGVVGKEGNTRDYFLQGLQHLQNRGYDGIGIASIDSTGGIVISKRVSVDGSDSLSEDTVLELVQEHYSNHPSVRPTGMAHTRWATHGAKSDTSNVHPHFDASGKIALIHNGSLINARELRDELRTMGYKFEGHTDSEVLAKLIGHFYSQNGVRSVKEATEKALRKCIGTWGICLLCSDEPDELVVACHGSSLFIGVGDDRIFVASEKNAFSRFTKNYIAMKDGEIGVLDADGRTLDLSRKETSLQEDEEQEILPPEYPHWTIKEILEQPIAVGRALCFGARLGWEKVYLGGLDSNAELLKSVKHLALVGCGSSLNAAKYGERLLKHLTSVTGRISSMDAVEVDYFDFCNTTSDPAATGIIALSQSGETADVKRVLAGALEEGFTTLGVVNDVGSAVARMVKMGVYCHAGNENGVASTKTFTSQVTILALIALWFRELHNPTSSVESERLKEALLRLPISLGMALKSQEQCRRIAERLSKKEHCFVLGKGFGEPIAYEGALKIKEMSYVHAEGYSGGALKHGPFALIDDDKSGKFGATPIIMLVLDDQHAHHMRTACEEVRSSISSRDSCVEGNIVLLTILLIIGQGAWSRFDHHYRQSRAGP